MPDPAIEVLRWTATLSGIVAAIMVSLNVGAKVTGWGFVVFLLCSLSWATVGLADDEHGLMIQNVVLTGVNLLGTYRYLIRKQPAKSA